MNANEGTHNLFILSSSPSCSPVTISPLRGGISGTMWDEAKHVDDQQRLQRFPGESDSV